ncbi:MAG: hypothetical protein A2268_13370 [Candidatus Raymondbacteria bacterium RifOxyA12_full_50_37]|uniref:FlgD Ig-like domain-containing protein n=1 Tax=Candidatus Raymondbacteria bacterium RIFOXYD12_FULL_49_13 TaxID=1817890 RepID=A0A1F7F069_UNCRA|nr:MAG: hypothetical protein A2268_13370 [Candidatus Raymondbacteria bacterium RifOxyA12_full_50_37]OGJ93050.1 MAG: hypothetical protein A2248_18505 [Candidatus Raymondbacteria bacterium RIFOXYA2_FULL_49_16]OGJ94882.1 MAG: hypothetical protein A2350_15555 [Candidatus Raymondbacteria bacterium RifOxyB12_full_50_8]OGJ99962.1 MAG: hypothetical protein A2519_00485 [Candidatus Raymondbacteria bacterium RIFOXYD12_FULL_49_13]OGK04154.1 MAG: hypothetical protein A2487_14165 [Candidatus Raymondbacteria 
MNKFFCALAAWLFCGAACFAGPAYTAFTALGHYPFLTRFPGPHAVFSFGSSAGFDNPAFFASASSHTLMAGGYGLQTPDFSKSPLLLDLSYTGRFLEKGAVGAGTAFFSNNGYNESVTSISFGAQALQLAYGASAKIMTSSGLSNGAYGKRTLTIDFDAGGLWEIVPRLYAGLALFNIIGTGVINDYAITISTERAAKVHFGYFIDQDRTAQVLAEGRIDSLHELRVRKYSWGAAMDKAFFEKRYLAVRAGFLSQTAARGADPDNAIMFGCTGNIPVRGSQLKIEYSLSYSLGNASAGNDATASHALRAGVAFGGYEDYVPPLAKVSIQQNALSPNGDGVDDAITFFISAKDNAGGTGIKKWALILYTREPGRRLRAIKSFSGTGVPPTAIEWDGRDAGNTLVAKGAYHYQLRVVDQANNFSDSPLFTILVQ